MSVITVTNDTALAAAVKAAKSGDVLSLAPGRYTALLLSRRQRLTFRSQDPDNPAVLESLHLADCASLVFAGIELDAGRSMDPYANRIYRSSVAFSDMHVHGDASEPPTASVTAGLAFFNCGTVSVMNSRFDHLNRGIVNDGTSGGNFVGNVFSDMRSDGIDNTASSQVLIAGNVFCDFYPEPKDHPDAIQFWTSGQTVANHDITVRDNLIVRGLGAPMQGVFMKDETGKLLSKEVPGDEPIVMVELLNSTPEPDGSVKVYHLRVPPTMKRAREAVAWTFGVSEKEYRNMVES